MQFIDETGNKYGRLTILSFSNFKAESNGRRPYWNCQCECGETVQRSSHSMKSGRTSSCGCLRREMTVKRNTTHGQAVRKQQTDEYNTWCEIIKRTTNPKCSQYPDYGGRGIAMCPEWRNSFESFLAEVGKKPSKLHSINRINNEKSYEPGNCCWSTRAEQNRNKRNNVMITHDGVTMCAADWCEKTKIKVPTFHSRLNRGWSFKKTITTPVRATPTS